MSLKMKEIKAMSNDDLNKRLDDLRMGLIKMNGQVATGTVPKSSGQLRENKKTIAKILSAIDKKESKKE